MTQLSFPYQTPRVTFVGADPKIGALKKAIGRVAYARPYIHLHPDDSRAVLRFVGLWQARNRRTRVLMARVRDANAR